MRAAGKKPVGRPARPAAEKIVDFKSGEHRLRGMLHLPKARRAAPGVLILHGFTGDRIGPGFLLVKISRELSNVGIASLRFDFAGSGESEGRFRDMSILTELEDARNALAFLAGQKGVDAERLGVLGQSLGGVVAAMLLESAPLKSALLLSAPAKLAELVEEVTTAEDESRMEEHGYFLHGVHEVGRRFVEDAKAARPLAAVAESSADILIMHGADDETVPPGHAHMYEEAALSRPPAAACPRPAVRRTGGTRKQAQAGDGPRTRSGLVPGMGHTPETREHELGVLAIAATWFKQTLAPKRGGRAGRRKTRKPGKGEDHGHGRHRR